MNYPDFKVVVRCFTFNHSKYIVDAMNGFTIQQTDFPFVCCIVDDASTDGEQEIIHKYMEANFAISDGTVAYQKETEFAHIIFAPHKVNKNCYFAVLYLKENHYSNPQKYRGKKREYLKEWNNNVPYEAICEGDDYWIDPLKLQKQVDFLEENPEYSMCFHNAFISIIEKGKRKAEIFNIEDNEYDLTFENAIKKWHVPTASMLMRKEACENIPSYIKQIYSGDIILILVLILRGKVRYLNEVMSIYRKVDDGKSVSQRVKGSYYFSQMVLLYESFLNAPELNESQMLILNQQISFYRLLHDYHLIKERKEYHKFLLPKYWKLLFSKILTKINTKNIA